MVCNVCVFVLASAVMASLTYLLIDGLLFVCCMLLFVLLFAVFDDVVFVFCGSSCLCVVRRPLWLL